MKIKRGSTGLIIVATLLMLGLAYAQWRITRHARPPEGGVIIRIGHYELSTGVREAFDEAARAYERLHPGVRIRQTAVPFQTFLAWSNTQLIGGNPPDILQLNTLRDELVARHFVPLDDALAAPNPYHAGTPLGGLPWNETFVDGAEGGFRYGLMQQVGVPLTINTRRLVYNRDLLRRLTGVDTPPDDWAGWIRLCQRIRYAGARERVPVWPLAGSEATLGALVQPLLAHHTQHLALQLPGNENALAGGQEAAVAWLRGAWGWDGPPLREALQRILEVKALLPPAFFELTRDQGYFYFLESRAVFLPTQSLELAALEAQAQFELGVMHLPLPGPDTLPAWIRGPIAESGGYSPGDKAFGISRHSAHADVALDFLRFLTSPEVYASFARTARWNPIVVGVESEGLLRAFAPRLDGYPAGFDFNFGWLGRDSERAFNTSRHLLLGPRADVDTFIAAYRERLARGLAQDFRAMERAQRLGSARQDALLVALAAQAAAGVPGAERRLDDVALVQGYIDARAHWATAAARVDSEH